MLKHLSDQKDCYALSQSEAQRLRDTYNLLALGSERKLEEVEIEEIDNFLKFGPILWLDAISGFEAGRKDTDDCEGVPVDDLSSSCKTDNYYRQKGYDVKGARSTLKWMSESPWLTEYLERHDEDLLILKNLFYCALKADEDDFCFENTLANPCEFRIPPKTLDRLYEPVFTLKTNTQKKAFKDAIVHSLSLLHNSCTVSDFIDPPDLLDGLTEKEIDGRKTIFYILNHDISTNAKFFNFIHEEVIIKEICEAKNKDDFNILPNIPFIDLWTTEDICILGTYCLAGTEDDDNEDRAKIAEIINDSRVERHITDQLGITEDTHKWPAAACQQL